MAEYQKQKEEVQMFLNHMKAILPRKGNISINIWPWKGNRVNKTQAYMAETGISLDDIIKVLYELQVCHYSYTADDRNINYKNEQVWIFGIRKNLVDEDVDIYIKLKIRKLDNDILLIMSFHPENPGCDEQRLKFPYRESE